MVTDTATIKTQSCQLPLDAFQHVGISRHNILTDNRGVLKLKYD